MSAGPIPPRWLRCPRKSDQLIGGKFLAFKTPLDSRFDDQVPPESLWMPSMLFQAMKGYKAKIGLWIDLCNTSRFYKRQVVEENDCRYMKLQCRGHGETPSPEQVSTFVRICRQFIQQHPLEIIAVHCTHGFNRTGFLICSFLIETEDWSPEAAVTAFANARPPGIYKADYLNELFERYNGDKNDAPAPPELPDWCFEEEDNLDDDGNALNNSFGSDHGGGSGGGGGRSNGKIGKIPQFMEGVPGVSPVTTQPLLGRLQRRFQELAGYHGRRGFPGSQPVSMDRDNLQYLRQNPYKVSWKADGTRYMMLIDGPNSVFFADRDNCVFKVENLTFINRKNENEHLSSTLLDGEMVIDFDPVNNKQVPRYLVYDIIEFFQNGKTTGVGKATFDTRMMCIQKEIIGARHQYIQQGKINKEQESFSIRMKEFWDVSRTEKLLGPDFQKARLGHEPDGLIFQPVFHPYAPGRDDKILKWKPSSMNSVDFKLIITRENRPGMVAKSLGCLYVGGHQPPVSEIKLNSVLRELNHKIIECRWDFDKNAWKFMRQRTDKSFPNAYTTFMGVWKSIAEPVTEEMLLSFIKHQVIPAQEQARMERKRRSSSESGQSQSGEFLPPPPKFKADPPAEAAGP